MKHFDKAAIEALIPHREPFLFLDSVEIIDVACARGVTNFSLSNPILQGHFPGRPIVPGVCQIEACAQLAGVLLASQAEESIKSSQGVLASVRNAKFQSVLLPSIEQLAIEVQIRKMNTQMFVVTATGQSNVDGRRVMDCELLIAIADGATPAKFSQPKEKR